MKVQPLEIAIVTRAFPPTLGGMQTHAFNLASELARAGDLVTVYTNEKLGVPNPPFRQMRILTDDFARDKSRLTGETSNAWLLMSAGLVPLAKHLKGKVFGYFHGNDFLYPFFYRGSRWIRRLKTTPYFWRVNPTLKTRFGRREIRACLPYLSKIFTNSTNTRRLIQEIYGVEASVVWPGVDDFFFQIPVESRRSSSDHNRAIELVTVSRLSNRRKNIDGVLEALTLLRKEIDFRYTIIGDGGDLERLKAVRDRLGLSERVRFLGRVSGEDLRRGYADADLFVLASKATAKDIEGFGIVFAEASAAGTAVLGSREGGAVDAIGDGVNGILIENSSPDAIARGIERFVERRSEFPPTKVRQFAEQFRWSEVCAALRKEIRELLHASGDQSH